MFKNFVNVFKNIIRPFKHYRQLEQSDCGFACVRMIANYYGKNVSLDYLHANFEINKLGISIKDLLDCLNLVNIEAHPVKIGIDLLNEVPLPAILFWERNHFVVLYKINPDKDRYYIADPAQGKVVLSKSELSDHWHGSDESRGIVILAAPDENFNPVEDAGTKKDNYLIELVKSAAKTNLRRFSSVILLSLLLLLADVASPYLFKATIDEGIQNKDIGLVWLLLLGQLGVVLGYFASNSVMNLLMTKLGLSLNIKMLGTYFSKLLNMPWSFFDAQTTTELMQKVNDQSKIKNFMIALPRNFIVTTVSATVFSVILLCFSVKVFCIFCIMSLIEFLWALLFFHKSRSLDYTLFLKLSENNNIIYELLNGITEIKSNNAHSNKINKWIKSQNTINDLNLKNSYVNIANDGGRTFFSRSKDLIITAICAGMVISGDMTLGIMFTVSYVVGRLSAPLASIIGIVSQYKEAQISYERLSKVLMENDQHQVSAQVPDVGNIVIDDMSFRYPGMTNHWVLNDINLVIPKGYTCALVGETGCGKSTLIKLLLGFYRPQKGSICIENIPICEMEEKSRLEKYSVVWQEGFLFSDTIINNIALCDETPDIEKVKEVARLAEIDEFIQNLPNGYYTKIGANGLSVSGGQKQRIMIARALYKNPEILFLDEATSSLDAHTEKRIVDNLTMFCKGRTVVIAAHRLSTIKNADIIVYMKDGSIKEIGNHEYLLKRMGDYHNLVKNQIE